VPYILHIALRSSDTNTLSNVTTFSLNKINIFYTKILKNIYIYVFLCVYVGHAFLTPMSFLLMERVA